MKGWSLFALGFLQIYRNKRAQQRKFHAYIFSEQLFGENICLKFPLLGCFLEINLKKPQSRKWSTSQSLEKITLVLQSSVERVAKFMNMAYYFEHLYSKKTFCYLTYYGFDAYCRTEKQTTYFFKWYDAHLTFRQSFYKVSSKRIGKNSLNLSIRYLAINYRTQLLLREIIHERECLS